MTLIETAQLLGNFGEFVGAFAVVATLFYLAIQVRHGNEATLANTKSVEQSERASRAQVRNSITEQVVQINSLTLSQPALLAVQGRSMRNESLDENETDQVRALAYIWLKYGENVHYQYRQGLYEESEYRAERELWRVRAQESALRDMWARSRRTFSPPFVQEIDQIIADSEK
jgi:hypothetical protein